MKKKISKEFLDAINYAKGSLPDEKPILYAFDDLFGIFVIRSSDRFNTWYSFYTFSSFTTHAVCFRAVKSKLQADHIFSALTAMPY